MLVYLKDKILSIVILLLIALYSFHHYLPSNLAVHILRAPYILLIALAMIFILGLFRKKYVLEGAIKKSLILVIVLYGVYVVVTALRLFSSGLASARPSLYLAMSILLSTSVFFCFYFDIIPNQNFESNIIIVFSTANAIQCVLGLTTYGGLRSSYLFENIMVYIFFIVVFTPLLFLFLNNKQTKLNKILIYSNIIIGVSFVSITGSRSGVLMIWSVLFLCLLISFLIHKQVMILKSIVIILGIIGLSGILYVSDVMNSRDSINRVFLSFNIMNSTNENTDIIEDIPQESLAIVEVSPQIIQDSFIMDGINQSNFSRSALWEASIEEIKKSPIIGTGVVYFEQTYGPFVLKQGSHNFLLEVWLIFGLAGLVVYILLYLVIILLLIKRIVKNKNKEIPAMCLISIFGAFSLALFQPLMAMLLPNVFLWLILAYCVNESLQIQQEI